MSADHHDLPVSDHVPKPSSTKTYVAVTLALLVLAFTAIGFAKFAPTQLANIAPEFVSGYYGDLIIGGVLIHNSILLVLAIAMALIVTGCHMRLGGADNISRATFISGLFFLSLFFLFTLSDTATRENKPGAYINGNTPASFRELTERPGANSPAPGSPRIGRPTLIKAAPGYDAHGHKLGEHEGHGHGHGHDHDHGSHAH